MNRIMKDGEFTPFTSLLKLYDEYMYGFCDSKVVQSSSDKALNLVSAFYGKIWMVVPIELLSIPMSGPLTVKFLAWTQFIIEGRIVAGRSIILNICFAIGG